MKQNEFRVHQLWSKPIYENYIPVNDDWITLAKVENYKRTDSNNGDITKDYYILNKLPNLKNEIQNHCNIFLEKYLKVKKNTEFYITNSWMLKHNPNDFAQNHYHTNSLLSGVYYLDVPENSGDFVFLRNEQLTHIFPPAFNIEFDEDTSVNCQNYKIKTEAGKIIIFPSQMYHGVLENLSDKCRYSLAFNFYAKGKVGRDECQLELK